MGNSFCSRGWLLTRPLAEVPIRSECPSFATSNPSDSKNLTFLVVSARGLRLSNFVASHVLYTRGMSNVESNQRQLV